MSVQKPSIPKGTRDFSAIEVIRRDFIFDTIKQVFRLFGYQPLETPAMENLSTLLGKYGEEGDKLLFRILNSGDFMSAADGRDLNSMNSSELSTLICEKGLRYDLTVPFARYVVQHRNEIVFPFKRYQIQPVWRADRPQKGRYREFFQCDADVIGSDSLLNEYELVRIIDEVFKRLRINAVIKINNRKILTGIAEVIGEHERFQDLTTAIDKLEKTGIEDVMKDLSDRGFSASSIDRLKPFINLSGNNSEKLAKLSEMLEASSEGQKGIGELKELFALFGFGPLSSEPELDITLARGLNYYTGAIIEVKAKDVVIGSICGGGRYDNLTGVFGLDGVSGVGISFGADRIYDVMSQLNLFEDIEASITQVLVLNFGPASTRFCQQLLDVLRSLSIVSELYPDPVKLKKQLAYADARKIPYVIMAGEDEIKQNLLTVKTMSTGEQRKITAEEFASFAESHFRRMT
ncbi:MAG: histidine--tRNA ligase [Bacteroidales bacterium]|nr:histidine--tRNA ligase [Bacteroidales bacterium]